MKIENKQPRARNNQLEQPLQLITAGDKNKNDKLTRETNTVILQLIELEISLTKVSGLSLGYGKNLN